MPLERLEIQSFVRACKCGTAVEAVPVVCLLAILQSTNSSVAGI